MFGREMELVLFRDLRGLLRGFCLTHPATPGWGVWAARWQKADRYIEFDIAACEIEPDNERRPGVSLAWRGSSFTPFRAEGPEQ